MKTLLVLRWIAGIVLAAFLTLGLAIIVFHHVVEIDMNNPTPIQFWVSNFFLSLAFGLFLFIACWFAPRWKRNAGLLVLVFSLVFISLGVYHHFTDDGYLNQDHIIRYSSFIICLVLSMFISHKVFQNRSW
jgi:peptidoglycan/LPS O-acetylase OafA/YrhL